MMRLQVRRDPVRRCLREGGDVGPGESHRVLCAARDGGRFPIDASAAPIRVG